MKTQRELSEWLKKAAKRWCRYSMHSEGLESKDKHLDIAQWMHGQGQRIRRERKGKGSDDT